ncbi:hypothetical protein CXB51_024538 [Gossypium anomalum]|uniref:Strictosidine synthase conserved region domain-containing protein n=1 Tax=Gossypium anomalum TaxID=47600 RepID=A0A8J5YDR8_9ROSI|nr:hypothetical protein CXB51_024538 [Gossypium anomalum]
MCGRSLGLKFNTQTCLLYITYAYFGLLVVGPNGGTTIKLAILTEGVPFKFTNGLDIDTSTGIFYFTDSSILFQRRDADFLISSSDRIGRLLKYNPYIRDIFVLYDGLAFPNEVALSANNSFILFNMHGPKAAPKIFAKLPRISNYIKRNENGSGRLGTIENDAPDPI